jgi:hypothetical protein
MMDNKVETLLKVQNDLLSTLIREVRALNPEKRTRPEANPVSEISLAPSMETSLGANDKSTWIVTQIGSKKVAGVTLVPLDEFYGTRKQAEERLKLFTASYPQFTIKLLSVQEYFDLKNQNFELNKQKADPKKTKEELTNMLTQLFETILGPPPSPKSGIRDAQPSDFKKDPWSNN